MQTGYQMAHAGSRLKPTDCLERHRLESQPSSRTGENPPYGMIGRIEETSASYEARSAPRSYPTTIGSLASLFPPRRHLRCSAHLGLMSDIVRCRLVPEAGIRLSPCRLVLFHDSQSQFSSAFQSRFVLSAVSGDFLFALQPLAEYSMLSAGGAYSLFR
jgi:hypothetical protein